MTTTTTAPKPVPAKAQLPWDRIAAGVPAATMTLLLGIISLGSAAFFHLDAKIDANYKDLSDRIDTNYKDLSDRIDTNYKDLGSQINGVRQDISDLKTLIIQSI